MCYIPSPYMITDKEIEDKPIDVILKGTLDILFMKIQELENRVKELEKNR